MNKGFLSRTVKRLKKKAGPLPLWVWVVVTLGAVIYYRRKHAAATSSATDATSATGATASTGPDGQDYWTDTGQPSGYSSGGGGGGSTGSGDPGGGADPTPTPTSGTTPGGGTTAPGTPTPPGSKKPRHRKKPPHVGHPKPHKKSGHTKPPKPKGRTKTNRAQPVHYRGSVVAHPARAVAAHAEPPHRPTSHVQPARHTLPAGGRMLGGASAVHKKTKAVAKVKRKGKK